MPARRVDTLPTHPRTGQRALYVSPRTGRVFWPILGGSGEGGDPPTPPAPAGDPATDPASTTPPPAADLAAAQELTDAQQRAEDAATERDQLRAALDAVNKAMNPDGEAGEQGPAKLAAAVADRDTQLADAASQLRTAQVELAAYKAAGAEGARADRLLNSRAFVEAVAPLDPADAKFGEQLVAAIKAAVEADPDLYRAAPATPGRGGAEFNSAPAADRKPANLHDAIAARIGGYKSYRVTGWGCWVAVPAGVEPPEDLVS
ncbi:hypothetical protein ACIBEA_44190 [Streptomyces sp. NPDC051555]|uniref:hypothetical protein n=1 Tax=Streptomyces sp. NPDC051555 TaxID=3365657 RepID=UPI0037A2CCD0